MLARCGTMEYPHIAGGIGMIVFGKHLTISYKVEDTATIWPI